MDAISEARDQLQGALLAAGNTPRKRNTDWDTSDDEDNLIDIQDVAIPTRTPKRRRRKAPPAENQRDSYVMKLFDRSVNLAQFRPSTPLYPVCRAWMLNDPQSAVPRPPSPPPPLRQEPAGGGDSAEDGDAGGLVFSLPRPDPPAVDPATGLAADPRLPATARPPPPRQLPLLHPSKADDAPVKSQLLAGHLWHWRNVRRTWRQAAVANERRYAVSLNMLTSMCVPDS